MPGVVDREAKSEATGHQFQCVVNLIAVLSSAGSWWKPKNAKLGASDPSLNLYINMKWSKTKYLGSCIAF